MEAPKESSVSCIPSEKNSLLIGEVRKFPSLYDTSDPNYYVLAERNKAWLRVAENCDEPAELCHLRWKSLRKRYAKEKRRFPEILQGHRRPWVLFPKMSFLTPATLKRRIRPNKSKRKLDQAATVSEKGFKQTASDDDMLILDDNDEIVRTCKVEMSEDEYIYETLDDPDSALEIINSNPPPRVKPTAIRSGGSLLVPTAMQTRGPARIRRLTPKMQNSIIAKKLKQAQQILQQSNDHNNSLNKSNTAVKKNIESIKTPVVNKPHSDKTVLYQDKTTRHIATVNPNIIRVERIDEKDQTLPITPSSSEPIPSKRESPASEGSRPFKVIKLKGRNPIIFSPEQLPNIQSFLKSESSPTKEQFEVKSPVIKVKSVDNLNSQKTPPSNNETGENNNLDIIHSVGLMRKTATADKSTSVEKPSNQSYSRSYSWNRPKTATKQTATERIQPDSQTKDYEIEETWNDIKEEHIDDENAPWLHSHHMDAPNVPHETLFHSPEAGHRVNSWNRVNEAKLELIAFQRKLLEDQHKKNLEYMKKEHDLKMTLLKAEIDLKRKQLNIMM